MSGNIIRKLFVAAVIIAPLFFQAECKKQPRCGCSGDVLFTLTDSQAKVVFNDTGTNIYFSLDSDPYSTYYFCNPSQMFPKFTDWKSGDELLVSGSAYWECNYVYQSSNYSYQSVYKVYNIMVTNVRTNLFGKK